MPFAFLAVSEPELGPSFRAKIYSPLVQTFDNKASDVPPTVTFPECVHVGCAYPKRGRLAKNGIIGVLEAFRVEVVFIAVMGSVPMAGKKRIEPAPAPAGSWAGWPNGEAEPG